MTDARHPDAYLTDRRVQRLRRRPEWWSYTMLLLWCVRHRTDGVIELDDIDVGLIPGVEPSDVPVLCDVGLLEAGVDRTVVLVDYEATQTSRAQLEAAEAARDAIRAKDRQRKRKRPQQAPVRVDSPGNSARNPSGIPPEEDRRNAGSTEEQEQEQAKAKAKAQALTGPPMEVDGIEIDTDSGSPVICENRGHKGCGSQSTDECAECVWVAHG